MDGAKKEINVINKKRNSNYQKDNENDLRMFLRKMEVIIKSESRTLLRERFAYPIFLYEAEKVGITSTGEADQNELYPNINQPSNKGGKTCLELYEIFIKNPESFLEKGL